LVVGRQHLNMDITHLKTFLAVAEAANLTRAARQLYMTPPAVSAHIKALEESLGVPLFVRTRTGMTLTDQGLALREHARAVIDASDRLSDRAAGMRGQLAGRASIGLNASPSFLRLPETILRLQRDSPALELVLTSTSTAGVLDGLRTRALHAGFVFGDISGGDLLADPVCTAELVVAAPAAWAAKLTGASWADVCTLPWVYSTCYCPFQQRLDDKLAAQKLAVSQKVASNDELTKRELVSAGVGLALIERSDAEEGVRGGGLVIWPGDPTPCTLAFACLAARADDPLIIAVRTAVRAVWSGA
jgi:DNA-binding transcriptional LysR family regulator